MRGSIAERYLISLLEFENQLSDLVDGHVSLSSHRLNITMRVLTVITAIFVPLTFIAGIYGMNFVHMPELEHCYGYFVVLGMMLGIGLTLAWVFRRKGWL